VANIPIDDVVDNPFQPRQDFDPAALQSLADEMKAEGFWNGSLQGRRRKDGKIELVFGHRRLRALRLTGERSISIDVLKLTDAQMALRSLEENLQREGLTDLEKSDAVKKAVEIERAALRADGKNESHAVAQVSERLGLARSWVDKLCQISTSLDVKNREAVEAGFLSAKATYEAKSWGGDAYAKTLAKQGKQASKDPAVAKPTEHTVAGMKKAVREAPEPVRKKLKDKIIAGKITTPKEAERLARTLAATHTKKHKTPPPDLKVVILDWTDRIKDLEKQMREIEPYMDYVEEVPAIAEKFRTALRQLIDTANKLL
jgi:ParB/RepB/Spo0J family partition protein